MSFPSRKCPKCNLEDHEEELLRDDELWLIDSPLGVFNGFSRFYRKYSRYDGGYEKRKRGRYYQVYKCNQCNHVFSGGMVLFD